MEYDLYTCTLLFSYSGWVRKVAMIGGRLSSYGGCNIRHQQFQCSFSYVSLIFLSERKNHFSYETTDLGIKIVGRLSMTLRAESKRQR